MKGRLAALWYLASAGTALAQAELAAPWLSSDLAEAVIGLYCADPASRPADPAGAGPDGLLYLSRTPDFVSSERQVPARVGMAFGIAFRTLPGRVDPPFDITMTHPPLPGLAGTETRWQSAPARDGWHTDGWSFETVTVTQPGLWTLRGEDEERLLFEVTFEVVPAVLRPDLAAACP